MRTNMSLSEPAEAEETSSNERSTVRDDGTDSEPSSPSPLPRQRAKPAADRARIPRSRSKSGERVHPPGQRREGSGERPRSPLAPASENVATTGAGLGSSKRKLSHASQGSFDG